MLPSPPPIYRRAQKGREKREFTVTTYLAGLTGSEVAEAVLLFLSREDDSFSAFVSRYTGYGHQAIGAQLRCLESAGVVIRKRYGRAEFYSFDRTKPWIPPLIESIKAYYNALRPEEQRAMFMRKDLNSPLRSHSRRLEWFEEQGGRRAFNGKQLLRGRRRRIANREGLLQRRGGKALSLTD